MTKEQIIKRREEMVADRAAAAAECGTHVQNRGPGWAERVAELGRLQDTQFGVIQDCDHWLHVIAAEEERAIGFQEGDKQRAKVLSMGTICEQIAQREAAASDLIDQAEIREAMRETPEERAG